MRKKQGKTRSQSKKRSRKKKESNVVAIILKSNGDDCNELKKDRRKEGTKLKDLKIYDFHKL